MLHSDHKLVALVAGMGGSGCNKPCFLCNWDRSTPFAVAEERSEEALRQISGWAETFLSPIVDAETQVKRTMTGIKSSAGKGRKGGRGGEDRQMTAEQAAELAAAKNARARAVKMVGDQLAKESDLALAHVLRSASMLQQRVSSWPAKHFVQPVKPFTQAAAAAVQDMPALCDRIDNAHIDLQEAGAHLVGLKEQLARMPPEDAGEVEHDRLLDSIEQAEDHVEVAEEVLASLEADWAAKVAQVNALDDLVVKVEDKRVNGKRFVSVLQPAPQFDKMAKAHLREILSEACEGIFRGSIIKDFIPPNFPYIESLHLVLNTGNCWFEVARKCFQYLLTAEGEV
jgi:hypothetical protein